MAFNAKNPLISPKATEVPPPPLQGTDGLFPMDDGWYRIDEDGKTYKFVADNNYVHTDNNFTDEEKEKLQSVENGSQKNMIETVKVNGNSLSIKEKAVDINVPTKLSELSNDGNFVQDANYVHTDNNYSPSEKNYVASAYRNSKNASQIVAFNNYEEFVEHFNNTDDLPNCTFPPISGQIIVIKDPNVPHLLVKSANASTYPSIYEFKSNEEFLADMERYPDEGLIVGYHAFGLLETKKDALPTKTSDLLNDSNFVQDSKYVHTDNNYTTAEKNKLTKIEDEAQVNVIESVKVNGSGLSVSNKSVDVSVPTKLSELNNDGNFVTDAKYVHTDNNFTNEYKSLIDANKRSAITAIEIARGANQAKSFNNYGEMIEFLNQNPNWGTIDGVTLEYQDGQNIMIGTVNVPDLWIASGRNIPPVNYTYTTDEAFVNDLNTALANGTFLRVGFITLGILETQKVDLTEYPTTEQMNSAIQTAVDGQVANLLAQMQWGEF